MGDVFIIPGDHSRLHRRPHFEAPTLRMGASRDLHPKFKGSGKVMPPKDMPKWFLGQQKTGWWFQTFFIFTPIWGNDPI